MVRTETVTIVFTDLVGSTEIASRLGHDAYEPVRRLHFDALRRAVIEHNGREVKTTGDGLMLSFASAADAVACAVAMQQAADLGARRNGGEPKIRVGASSGEATREDGDLYGPPVIEAFRLCAAASPGQILVSDLIRGLARGRGHKFAAVGDLKLKGLPEPICASEVAWEPLVEAPENALPLSSPVWSIATKGSPFRGLAPFDPVHAAVFFGRSRAVVRLIARLKAASERNSPFLLVVGASGSGKSSLVRAGLVPQLTAGIVDEVDVWRVAIMRPGTDSNPVGALAEALFAEQQTSDCSPNTCALPELGEGDFRTPQQLAALMRIADAAATHPIERALDRVSSRENNRGGYQRAPRANLLLVVDQLDDLFAVTMAVDERTNFVKLLRALVSTQRVWVVATLRAALYEGFLAEPDLVALKEAGAHYDLSQPGPAHLAEIIRGPAEAAGLVYECNSDGESLDEVLLRDAVGSDVLPLLQFTLQGLFERRQVTGEETRLTFSAYNEISGLDGAIDQAAEAALADLGQTEISAIPRLLRQLAIPVHDRTLSSPIYSTLTTRDVALAEAAPASTSRRLVDALVEARILLLSEQGGIPTVRLAHQRVLESWKRLRALVESDADFYRIRSEIEDQRRRWEASKRKAELLLPSGLPLAEAESIIALHADEVDSETRVFVAASGRRARLRQRLSVVAAAVFGLVALTSIALGIFAQHEAMLAEQNYAVAKQAADSLVVNIAQRLRNVQGMTIESTRRILDAADGVMERLASSTPNDFELQRSRVVMLREFARTYANAGDLPHARTAADESLKIARALAGTHPGHAEQQGVGLSLARVGEISAIAGDRTGARADYEESLAIARKLVAADPENAEWQRDLIATVLRLGDNKVTEGDRAGALATYGEGLDIARNFAWKRPDQIERQRDVATCLEKVGNILGNIAWALSPIVKLDYHEKDDPPPGTDREAALAAYEESVAIRRKLAAANPTNTDGQQELWISLLRIGDIRFDLRDLTGAIQAQEEGLAIQRTLLASDPGNTLWQRGVGVSLAKIGDERWAANDREGALAAYDENLAIVRKLAAIDPKNTLWQRDLSNGLSKMGAYRKVTGDRAGAFAAYEESLSIRRKLVAADPGNLQWQIDLVAGLYRMSSAADARTATTSLKEALSILETLERDGKITPTHKRWKSIIGDRIVQVSQSMETR
jgi:eukaryotic-like serine/threonine-protein kinase